MELGKCALWSALCFGAGGYAVAGEAENLDSRRRAGIEEAVMHHKESDEGKADIGKDDGVKKIGENVFMTFSKYLGDANKNGEIDAEEFKGLGKRKFSKKEKVTFFVCINGKKGSKLEFALRNTEGERVAKGESDSNINSDKFLIGHEIDTGDYWPGKYYGCWYVDGKLIGNNYSIEISK